jgi:hypothetical protein
VRRWLLTTLVLALGLAGAPSALGASSVATPLDVHAERHGKAIRVTWRTARPAANTSFQVAALPLTGNPKDYVGRDGDGHRSFAVTLRPARPGRVRQVAVYASNDKTLARTHVTVTVR